MAPQWTPRMQELCEVIARYALDTGELPTFAECARRMGLSRTRIAGIWWRIEQHERGRRNRETINYGGRARAGYLLAVLKDIEKAAKMAGRAYPWRRKWQGPPKPPPKPRDNPRKSYLDRSWTEFAPPEPRWSWKPRFGDLIECKDCHGTAVKDGDWCPRCKGEGMVVWGEAKNEPTTRLH